MDYHRDTKPGDAPQETQGGDSSFVRKVTIAAGIASAFLVGFLLLIYAPDAVILFFAAIWFGAVMYHAGETLSRWTGLPRQWGIGAVLALVVIAAISFVALLGWQVASRLDELVKNMGTAVEQLKKQLANYPQLQQLIEKPPSPEKAMQVVSGGSSEQSMVTMLMTPFGFAVNVLFIFFTGAYLALAAKMYRNGFVALFPVKRRPKIERTCSEAGEALWHWTLARLASMALVGVLSGVGLALLGIPMAATLGVATALFVFVPNIGPVLATIPPLLLAFGQGGWTPLYVLALYIGIELVESWLITPIIHQKEDALPAAITIAVQLLFGILFGLLGVTFAMPIALIAMIFIQRLYVERGLEGTTVEKPIGTAS